MVWVALRAPRGRMQGDATRAMSERIGEERRRRRRPRATFGCGGRLATGSREILKAPGSPAPALTLSAAVRGANACGRKLDTTPASIFQQPAMSWADQAFPPGGNRAVSG